MEEARPKRNILCIDLKSFFASCECVERNIDGFNTPLVVAGNNKGAITLAVSPYLKKLGIKGRTRLYDIPQNIKYIRVPPRMSLYIKKSEEIVAIYLDYISKEDLYIYSIDECFLDVTNYLKLYNKTDYELAVDILNTIYNKTGLTATCGIGPNMLLAKIAMDIEAKKYKNGISKWTYDDIEDKLWTIQPLSKMWGIGPRMEANLNKLGIFTVHDLALFDKNALKDIFGIIGEELWNHAHGIDLSVINDYKQDPASKSFSHSQILYKDYNSENISLIISEMVDTIAQRLRENKKECSVIGFGIGYSKTNEGGFYHSIKSENSIYTKDDILKYCMLIFDKFYILNMPIRKVSITCGNLKNIKDIQLNLFDNKETINNISSTVDKIKKKFGKNSIVNASALTNDSTAIERNKKIRGHSA